MPAHDTRLHHGSLPGRAIRREPLAIEYHRFASVDNQDIRHLPSGWWIIPGVLFGLVAWAFILKDLVTWLI